VSSQFAGWVLVALAIAFLLIGCPLAALFIALGAGLCAVLGAETEEQADARRRNPSRYQAHRKAGLR
jgi:hypothetical protein